MVGRKVSLIEFGEISTGQGLKLTCCSAALTRHGLSNLPVIFFIKKCLSSVELLLLGVLRTTLILGLSGLSPLLVFFTNKFLPVYDFVRKVD